MAILLGMGLLGALPGIGGATAAAQATTAPSPDLNGLAHVAIRVKDLDASVAFYQRLGFVQAFALSRDGKVYEAFIKVNDRQFIELYPVDAQDTQIGFLHLCFEGGDLNAVHDYYVAHGLTPNAVRTAGAGNLLFTMPGPATPTGPQNMEYTQYMPGSMHSKAFGQFLGPERIATKMLSVSVAADDPAAAIAFYLGKVGFTHAAGGPEGKLAIPGSPGESIEIVPAAPLGFKSRITLAAEDPAKTAGRLKLLGVPFTRAGHSLTITDPDGNQIVLE